jgi:hypothetical protein
MLINLEGNGPIMWQGWGADSETPVYPMLPTDAETLLESAIEFFEASEKLEHSIFTEDAIVFNKAIVTLQQALGAVREEDTAILR